MPMPKLMICRRITSVKYVVTKMKQLIIIRKCSKLVQTNTKEGMKGCGSDSLGIVLETKIWLYRQMVYALTRIGLGKWDTWNFLGLRCTNILPNPRSDLVLINLLCCNFCHFSKP